MSKNVTRQAPPFAQVPQWIVLHESLSAFDVRVWMVIYLHSFQERGSVTLSQDQIAQEARASVSTVRRSVEALERAGAIAVEGQKDAHGRKANLYHLNDFQTGGTGHREQAGPVTENRPRTGHREQALLLLEEKETNAKPKASRPRNLLFEAIANVCDIDWKRAPKTELGPVQKATKELKEIGATPEDVQATAAAYREEWPDITVSPMALVKHWTRFSKPLSPLLPPDETPDDPEFCARVWAEYRENGFWVDNRGFTRYTDPADRGIPASGPGLRLPGDPAEIDSQPL